MALRFQFKGTAGGGISTASIPSGGQLNHGLGITPDEWFIAQHGLSASFFIAASVPDSVAIYISTGSAGALLAAFCAVNHSWMK